MWAVIVAPSITVQVVLSGDLSHFHVGSDVSPSISESVAVSSMPSTGCRVDRVTVPSSSTLVTVTVTMIMSLWSALSVASTITLYSLLSPFSPPPVDTSKSGVLAKVSTPSSILKSSSSWLLVSRDHVIAVPSGSSAVKVATGSMPFLSVFYFYWARALGISSTI